MQKRPADWVKALVTQLLIQITLVRKMPLDDHNKIDLLKTEHAEQLITSVEPQFLSRVRRTVVPLDDPAPYQLKYLKRIFGSLDMLDVVDDDETKNAIRYCLILFLSYLQGAIGPEDQIMSLAIVNEELLYRMMKWYLVYHEQRLSATAEPELFAWYDKPAYEAVGPVVVEFCLILLLSQSS